MTLNKAVSRPVVPHHLVWFSTVWFDSQVYNIDWTTLGPRTGAFVLAVKYGLDLSDSHMEVSRGCCYLKKHGMFKILGCGKHEYHRIILGHHSSKCGELVGKCLE